MSGVGVLRRLFARQPDTESPTDSQGTAGRVWSDMSARFGEPALYGGRHDLEIVGESNYQDALWRAVGGRTTERVRVEIRAVVADEPDNPHDRNACETDVGGCPRTGCPRPGSVGVRGSSPLSSTFGHSHNNVQILTCPSIDVLRRV